MHLVCILGEAASHVSDGFRASHSTIPWRDIVATRNRLIHGYETVGMNALWETVTHDLPDLINELDKMLP